MKTAQNTKESVTAKTTKVAACVCSHEYQDERYDRKRVMNPTAGKDGPKYRCTVCGREHAT